MMNFQRSEEVRLVRGKLWRYMRADGFLVAKVCEDGRQTSRNLDYCGMFGWRFLKPGKRFSRYYERFTAQLEEWGNYTPSLKDFCWFRPTDEDRAVILEKYPDFRWIMKKTEDNWSIAKIFKALELWKKDPQTMETLTSMGCFSLALNGSFYKAKDKKDLVKWMSRNPERGDESLQDIRLVRKYGCEWEEVRRYRSNNYSRHYLTFEEWRYLGETSIGSTYYRDYMRMAEKAGHDLKDPYWHYPKHLKKAHDKVMAECARIDRLKAAEKAAKKQAEYIEAVKKMAGKTLESAGLTVYVPQEIKDIERHAKKLHQCLVTADYIGKVAKKELVLVFVCKNGKPYATAEMVIKNNGYKLGQFYGNERLKDYEAKPDAVQVFNQWAKQYNIKVAA